MLSPRPANTTFRSRLIVGALTLAVASAAGTAPATAQSPTLTVALHQASGAPLSYFDLNARPGRLAQAGVVELSNHTARRMIVMLDPLGALTLSTLGSGYQPRGETLTGPARWLRIARRQVVLAPHAIVDVAVTVLPPRGTAPGDYLCGVGVQAVQRPNLTKLHSNVAIASIIRYAVGVEVRLPGPRHPLIRLTGASVDREPAGVTFSIFGRNPGNVILQDVQGSALITQGRRVVAHVPLGPGTFVTGTSIAYPIVTLGERPPQGTVYRVRALMRYHGGVAYLDTSLRFGRAAALAQQAYGGPKAPSAPSSGVPVWLAALGGLGGVLILFWLAVLLWKRRRGGPRATARKLDGILRASRRRGEPLTVIRVALGDGWSARKLAPVLLARLRHADRLYRLRRGGFLVLATDTDIETAEVLGADLRRHVPRERYGFGSVAIDVYNADDAASGAELLERLGDTSRDARAKREQRHPTPTG